MSKVEGKIENASCVMSCDPQQDPKINLLCDFMFYFQDHLQLLYSIGSNISTER